MNLLGLIGLTIIVTQSTLFAWLRKDSAFWSCAMCVGFWVGLLGGQPPGNLADGSLLAIAYARVLTGGAVSLLSYLAALVLYRLDD